MSTFAPCHTSAVQGTIQLEHSDWRQEGRIKLFLSKICGLDLYCCTSLACLCYPDAGCCKCLKTELILFESSYISNENLVWQLTVLKMNTFRDTQQAKEKGITDQGKNEAVYAFSLIEFFPCLCIISVVIIS